MKRTLWVAMIAAILFSLSGGAAILATASPAYTASVPTVLSTISELPEQATGCEGYPEESLASVVCTVAVLALWGVAYGIYKLNQLYQPTPPLSRPPPPSHSAFGGAVLGDNPSACATDRYSANCGRHRASHGR